ncbi:MAG TPA: flagellar motor switch protein FliG [Gemmatimonadaceae bacterium]|nr:flagellar motor switch protein FliG [Gemmatimonadaceae bacterium]
MTTAMARQVLGIAPPRRLTGREKAAIVYTALGAEAAAKITQRLSQEEAEAISYEIARLEGITGEMVEQVLQEWLELSLALDSFSAGGLDYAREMLEKAYGPQRAQQILKRIQNQLADTAGLHRLRKADPEQLGSMLRSEHPQTIALVLAHLEPQHTAGVLKELDPATGSEVVYRMAKMEKVSPEMLNLLERSIGSEADLGLSQGLAASGGPAAVAAVLNFAAGSLEKTLLDGVAARDARLCEEIKNLMFVFENLVTLDERSLQRLLREVDAKQLALALKAASEELKAKIMGAMSQRAVQALQEEMEFMGPVRMRDVEAAQTAIVAQVRALEEAGELVIGGNGSDDVVIG